MSNKVRHCDGCPIDIHHDRGDELSNYGCMPDYQQAKKWYLDTGKVWACHENNLYPCVGLLLRLKSDGIPISVNKKTILITENQTLEEIYESDSIRI